MLRCFHRGFCVPRGGVEGRPGFDACDEWVGVEPACRVWSLVPRARRSLVGGRRYLDLGLSGFYGGGGLEKLWKVFGAAGFWGIYLWVPTFIDEGLMSVCV